jgi:Holliday junction DNA helicase RuvA
MIGRIRGTLAAKHPPDILVEVGGVGYELQVPMTTLFQLPALGAEVSLVTHFVVREDAQLLYGFIDERDRGLFRQLIRINGVGPKMALAILSGIDERQFALCIANSDVAMLTRLPGVGKKTAERLIIEMRDRIDTPSAQTGATRVETEAGAKSEAVDALISLGYKPREVQKLIGELDVDGKSAEDIIRLALRQVAL